MSRIIHSVTAHTIRLILRIICKLDRKELKKIPRKGPFIIVMNHINFLEVPMIYTMLLPQRIVGLMKKESWDNRFLGWLSTLFGAIPLDRNGLPMEAFRLALSSLSQGRILVLAPEGTRSGDGQLKEAHPGIVTIAMKAGVPIIPVAHYGGEDFWENIVRLKRTNFTFRVGSAFILANKQPINKEIRKYYADQIMLRLACLMPEKYHGYYLNKQLQEKGLKDISLNGNTYI